MKNYGACFNCGKIESLINDSCDECYNEDMNNLKKLKAFLSKYPNSTAIDISLKTDISIDKITRLIKKGTLM